MSDEKCKTCEGLGWTFHFIEHPKHPRLLRFNCWNCGGTGRRYKVTDIAAQ